jgi:PAS domain S-box-containing protein
MSRLTGRHSSFDGLRIPKAAPYGFRHAATQSLFGVIGVAMITFVAVRFHIQTLPPSASIGPGTISLLYLIIIVFVSHRAGFVSSVAVSLMAAFCLNYFVLPLVPALKVKNPLDIVATVAFLITSWVITGLVAQLRERSALLDTLFEQAPQALALLVDVDMRVARVNREFAELFGYTPQEVLGRPLSELILSGEFRAEFQRHTELVFQGNRVDAETVRQRKDGRRLHVRAVGAHISLPSGQTAVYAMYSDITERKAAETALQALSIRLIEVQEAERRYLARELHDEIGQLLTGLRLLLRPIGDTPADVVKTRVEQALTIVDDLLARVRKLSFDLRPADLDQFGLVPALLALFERYTAQTEILVNFKHQGLEGRLASALETGAYRVVQEALTNAARHAGVASVTVRVWTDGNILNVRVEDQGRGFDPEAALKAPRSSGLTGMRERIMLLGGRMAIESFPKSGTTVTVELPLDKTTAV